MTMFIIFLIWGITADCSSEMLLTYIVGYHTYTCIVSNYAGNTNGTVNTVIIGKYHFKISMFTLIFFFNLIVYPVVSIHPTESLNLLSLFEMTCVASFLHPKLASQLVPYLELEWVGPDGNTLGDGDDIFVKEQSNSPDTAARLLKIIIKSLTMSHLGNYTCETKLHFFNSRHNIFFITTTSYFVTVHSKSFYHTGATQ